MKNKNNSVIERVRNKRKKQRRKTLVKLFVVFSLIMGISVYTAGLKNVKASVPYKKIFISKEIKSGDTLWDYAEQFADKNHYHSKREYIKEVMVLNGLESSDIYYGYQITLPVIQVLTE